MKNKISLQQPLFLFDCNVRELHYSVTDIVFATDKSLLVFAKLITNENVKNNEHFHKEAILEAENKLIEVLVDENLMAHADELDRYIIGNFSKIHFDNFTYNAPQNKYDENLKEENFSVANIASHCNPQVIQNWFDEANLKNSHLL